MDGPDNRINTETSKKALLPLMFSGTAGFLLLVVASETLAAGKLYLSAVIPLTIFQTVGFYVLIAQFLFSLLGGFYKLKIRKLRKRIGELETGVSEQKARY